MLSLHCCSCLAGYNFPSKMRHLATTFPVYIHLGSRTIHPHLFFQTLAYVAAFAVYLHLRRRFGDSLALPLRWATVAAAIAGAALGSKVLYWLEDPRATLQNLQNPAYLIGGKTIVGALIGGLVAVELMKRYIGLRTSTGDLYAVPLAIGIAIGRIGCFLTGLSDNTYGTPTSLLWGVDFGDGIPRHPTQLYEIAFLVALIPLPYKALKRIGSESDLYRNPDAGKEAPFPKPDARRLPVFRPGDAFKLFMIAYASFRLLDDFIKPYPRIFLGLGGIQWACVILLLYYAQDVRRLHRALHKA